MIHFDVEALKGKLRVQEELINHPDFWSDVDKARDILKNNKETKDSLNEFDSVVDQLEEMDILIELAEESDESDEEDSNQFDKDLKDLSNKLNEAIDDMFISILLDGKYDKNNAILSINPGTGGLDAQDWAQMLLRMYIRYGEDRDYKVRLLDLISDTEAGIKTAVILVQGKNAYGHLKGEKGVHRLVRMSPFDSSGKRHTSFASVDVMPEIEEDIEVDINISDIKVDTFRASGAGGQHVNTTDSAVRLTHIPTGVVVSCQNERSQHNNKEVAMKLLKAKLVSLKVQENKEKIEDLKGSYSQISWGSQIRSYVFQPYRLVKDHRTNSEITNVDDVMDGNIDQFINDYLKQKKVED